VSLLFIAVIQGRQHRLVDTLQHANVCATPTARTDRFRNVSIKMCTKQSQVYLYSLVDLNNIVFQLYSLPVNTTEITGHI
jgi:hypothetical protein